MRKLIISLLSLVVLASSGVAHAYSFSEWDDDVLCMWIKQKPNNAGYLTEAANRDLSCDGLITSSVASTKKVIVPMKPFRGDWIPSEINGVPMWSHLDVKRALSSGTQTPRYLGTGAGAFGDFDNDGIIDYFQIGMVRIPGISYAYSGPACEVALGDCFLQSGNLSVFKIKQLKTK